MSETPWQVYILRTRLNTLYTGITTNVERRLNEHAGVRSKGAKSLRAKAPLKLEYALGLPDRAVASRLENHIKQLSKNDKERLISAQPDYEALLSLLKLPIEETA